ncbi:MAG: hypothetical protein ACKPEN_09935 [Planktothrix sp.]|uniref:hypothetical protein n=1 Tax=Planktothrix sp. TaxID=3088171 RepID=UPI0038D41747
MSRKTLKYVKALEIDSEFTHLSGDELYNHLQDKGYYWASSLSQWVYSPEEQNDPPSQVIKIRILHDKNQIKAVAERLTKLMINDGYRFVESSVVHPCYPPRANDSKIYLTFQPSETL